MEKKYSVLYYAAAAATAIAGILHLILAPGMLNFNPNATILFAVGGAGADILGRSHGEKMGESLVFHRNCWHRCLYADLGDHKDAGQSYHRQGRAALTRWPLQSNRWKSCSLALRQRCSSWNRE